MSKKNIYSRETLINKYIEKTEEMKDIPTAENIEEDPEMPSYRTYKRRLGNLDNIKEIKEIRKKYRIIKLKNKAFCEVCTENPEDCGRDVEECKKEADLYFQFEDNGY